MGSGVGYPPEWPEVSLATKIDAGFRCVRCFHPNGIWVPEGASAERVGYRFEVSFGITNGAGVRLYPVPGGTWVRHHLVPCDDRCTHPKAPPVTGPKAGDDPNAWRILTVHHLDEVKANLAWWNLAALCQRCHLTIQGKVSMGQRYAFPHSDWFLPYVAGYYAYAVLGLVSITRADVEADLVRFLAAGQPALEDHYRERLG